MSSPKMSMMEKRIYNNIMSSGNKNNYGDIIDASFSSRSPYASNNLSNTKPKEPGLIIARPNLMIDTDEDS
jgi:hypothetical protein